MKTYKEILEENRAWAEETFKKVDNKLSAVAIRSRDKLVDGVGPDGVTHASTNTTSWTAGFFGGMNVLMWEHTKNEEYLKTAKRSEELLDEGFKKPTVLTHDVGFMWHILSGALYRLTGDEGSRVRNYYAAALLASRYIPSSKYIVAWNGNAWKWQGRSVANCSIIDTMMNMPLLFWASRLVDDDRFAQLAVLHADMTLAQHIRPDGSVVHIVDHDRATGECIDTIGGQGYAVGSSWSRGQTWAIYGFALMYRNTGDVKYLDAAKRVANYFISNIFDEWVPRSDFRAPNDPVYYDTSAATIAAAGMLEIAKAVPEYEGGIYANAAVNILKAVSSRFADFDPNTDVMITHSTRHCPVPGIRTEAQSGLHIPIIYAEFYYVEALLKLLGSEFNPWLS